MASRRLPNYLRTFRKRTGLSQEEVAFLLGCQSGNKASRYERRTRRPNLETILAYELVFGAPARELFAGIFDDVAEATLKRAHALAGKLKESKANLLVTQKLETLDAINSGEGGTSPQAL
jgi:transcriptional regulator with XRE-family HTH domain